MTDQNSSLRKSRPFWITLLINLGAMAVISCVLLWIGLKWLDSWTHHGEYILVPEVKGLSYRDAYDRLRNEGFDVEISDSIYESAGLAPGTVVEQNPKMDTKVKGGRKVYLTITALAPKTVTVPMLTDVSLRQARSVLEGLGFKHIRIDTVQSEYRNLVLGVKLQGQRLNPGARIPVTSTVTLEVGAGLPDNYYEGDEEPFSDSDFQPGEQLDLF